MLSLTDGNWFLLQTLQMNTKEHLKQTFPPKHFHFFDEIHCLEDLKQIDLVKSHSVLIIFV